MIAVDTNLLVYAHRRDSEWNASAYALLEELVAKPQRWSIPWPCVHEFFSIVTHPRIYAPPSTTAQACAQIDAWLSAPNVELISETPLHWPTLKSLLVGAKIAGPRVHDARIASLCLVNGVTELLTADRDFSRFPSLTTRNPLSA